MVKIEGFYITDHAIVSCKNKDKDRTEYRALLYRLFATNKPLYELSIYYKYFTKFTFYLDHDNLNLEELLEKYRSVHEISKDFMDKPDCSKEAKLLNELFDTLRTTLEFQTFYNILSYFSVKTKDSIYYPCCKECNGLFCVNKRYALAESRQFLFKRGSARARRVKSKSKSKSKSISKKSKKLIKKLHYL